MIVKPMRHCLHVWNLTNEETQELGPLLRRVAATIQAILKPDQVYVCLWSHADWKPGHIHFVLQPAWNHQGRDHQRPGPSLQVDLLRAQAQPPRKEVEAFSVRARDVIQRLELN